VIIEIDPQRSALAGMRVAPRNADSTRSQRTPPNSPAPLQQAKAGGAQVVIIDTAPHSSAAAAIAAKLADYVLIPCRPARYDLNQSLPSLEMVKAANMPAAVVINAAPPRGRLTEEVGDTLSRQGSTVIKTVRHQRAAIVTPSSMAGACTIMNRRKRRRR
jgi:chromosome partitioning protein